MVEHQAKYPAIGIEVVDHTDPTKQRTCVSCIVPTAPEVGKYYKAQYATVYDNQIQVDITIYFLNEREDEGNHKSDETDFSAWTKYKTFTISDLPPKPKGQPITVNLKYSEGGVIDGKAWDNTKKEVTITGKTA